MNKNPQTAVLVAVQTETACVLHDAACDKLVSGVSLTTLHDARDSAGPVSLSHWCKTDLFCLAHEFLLCV